jgi:hypothetical protein
MCGVLEFSIEVLDKLHSLNSKFDSIYSYDFSTLHTTLPHKLLKEMFLYLIK